MLFRPLLSFLAVSAFTASVGAAANPNFTLPYLASFEIHISADPDAVVYPYGGGQRVNIALISGTMTTPANGTVATLVPGLGGEQGVVREDGIFLVDARIVFKVEQSFDPDGKFAFLQVRGKAVFAADGAGFLFAEFETDSAPLAYLNGYFLSGKYTRNANTLSINVFGANPSTI